MSKQKTIWLCEDGCIEYKNECLKDGFHVEQTEKTPADLCLSLIKCDHCRDTIDHCVVAGTDRCVCDSRETLAIRRMVDWYHVDVETVDAIVADEIFYDIFEIDFIFSQVVHVVEVNLEPNSPRVLFCSKRIVTISQRVEELKKKGK